MGTKLTIPGADFSDSAIITAMSITLAPGASRVVGGTTLTAGLAETTFELPEPYLAFGSNSLDYDILELSYGVTFPFYGNGALKMNAALRRVTFRKPVIVADQNISTMFYNCRALEEASIVVADTQKLKVVHAAFSNCVALHTLHLGNTEFSDLTTYDRFFQNCTALNRVYCSTNNYLWLKERLEESGATGGTFRWIPSEMLLQRT